MQNDNFLFSEYLNTFRLFIDTLYETGDRYLIYGAGTVGRLLETLMPDRILAFVDQSADFHGKTIGGKTVYPPTEIDRLEYDAVIISVLGREKDIHRHLVKNHAVPEKKILTLHLQPALSRMAFLHDLNTILNSVADGNRPRTFLQVGASTGTLAYKFASDGWRVFGFDADPLYADRYRELNRNKNLHLFNRAISITDENSATFFLNESARTTSSLIRTHETDKPITVPAISLRRFYQEYQVDQIDFFMIDAEGMDLAILKTHNWRVPPKAVMAECSLAGVTEINQYLLEMNPAYLSVVFVWEKPTGVAGEMGKYLGKYSVADFKELPKNCFGDILCYQKIKERAPRSE
jgi:FkbM family methyltransferase